ncbi:hypothetical protein [uncultured Aquimonas sp.]|uniref:hypothetical protein n=1 Tax=uncultured Aquimonas sp. TaxID=385483 RepID=UPI00086EF4F8|nr:hypothetical protein [uncultured Aquimonas sp.]ODU41309.1 MAG: hypothetical protein ABS96_32235 [Xanthomonadaceae bacterium SCN 69-123]
MTRSISGGRALVVSYLSTIGGLLLGTVIGSLGLVLFEMTDECHQWAETLGLLSALPRFVMIAMLFGGLPALTLGAPLYAALLSHDLADYLTSAVLGAALVGPFFLLLLGGWGGLLFGPCVACATHFIAIRLLRGWLRPSRLCVDLRTCGYTVATNPHQTRS